MKKIVFCAMILWSGLSFGQNITLPKPQLTGGLSTLEAINTRHSSRSFLPKDLSLEDLSTILQAGFGYNNMGKRTAPTPINAQDIELYVFLQTGIYLWNAKDNVLVLIKKGDYRPKTEPREGFSAKVTNIAIVSDLSKYGQRKEKELFGAYSAAYVSENMYLAIQSMGKGIGTVVRHQGTQGEEIRQIMSLSKDEKLYLFQTIGYVK